MKKKRLLIIGDIVKHPPKKGVLPSEINIMGSRVPRPKPILITPKTLGSKVPRPKPVVILPSKPNVGRGRVTL